MIAAGRTNGRAEGSLRTSILRLDPAKPPRIGLKPTRKRVAEVERLLHEGQDVLAVAERVGLSLAVVKTVAGRLALERAALSVFILEVATPGDVVTIEDTGQAGSDVAEVAINEPSPVDAAVDQLIKSHARKLSKTTRRRIRILARGGGLCAYCGCDLLADVESFLNVTLDHVRPRHAEGSDAERNVVACCAACNSVKGGMLAASIGDARQLALARRLEMAVEMKIALRELRELLGRDAGPIDLANTAIPATAEALATQAEGFARMLRALASLAPKSAECTG